MQLPQELTKRIEGIISEFGLVIFYVNLVFQGKTKMIKILIDKPSGGITIKECSEVNIKLNEALENEFGPLSSFNLEVSSPGMDWPIKEKNDFQRVIFKKICICLKQFDPLNSKLEGVLKEVRDNSLILDLGDDSLEINFENINKAKEQY